MGRGRLFVLAMAVLLVGSPCQAESAEDSSQVEQFEEIVVTGEKIIVPTRETGETVYTGTEITSKGIEIQGAAASTSVYEAINLLPGVFVESADPYGLAAESRSIRVRGIRGSMGALSVEGISNWGGNPIGPREYLYDMENFRSISVYKGAIPADLDVGVGSRGGAIELKPLWPEKDMGFKFNQSVGTDSYQRTFLRFDSGSLSKLGTMLSGSYSYTDADKWKGPGTLGPRNNVNLALSQPLGSLVDVKLWFNYNKLEQNLYRSISYAQYQNLKDNYDFDYNETLTGTAAQDINYYDYNRGEYANRDIIGLITVKPNEQLSVKLKAYSTNEDTNIYQGTTSKGGMIQKRIRDIERLGGSLQADWDIGVFRTVAGYLYEDALMDISTQNYAITAAGLAYRGFGNAATAGHGHIHTPYLKFAGTYNKFDWQAGVKYFYFEDPASEGYVSGGAPTYALVRAPDLDREEKTYDIVLPTAGLGYKFSDSVNFYASYGKSFIRPYSYMPLVTLYNNNRATFVANGITLNDLFKGYDMEQSDNVELGVRFRKGRIDIAPAVFYGKHKNLLTTIYDPRVDLKYQQNVGKATGYGIDLESNIYLTRDLTVFVNPTYTCLKYDDDMTFKGYTLHTKDNQVADTPEFMVKTGLIWKWGDLEIIPSANFIGERYSDSENHEKVSSHVIANLIANYTLHKIPVAEKVKITLQLQNIFDKQYISAISVSDDALQGNASYQVGAPFSAILSASVEF